MTRIERNADAMGSAFSIILYGENEERMEEAVDAAFQEARRLDCLLSNYKSNSEWSEVNQWAATGPLPVSPELFWLLTQCLKYSRLSDGAFDITVGALMKVWGFYRSDGHVPDAATLAAARACTGCGHLRLDAEAQTVQFDRAGVELDPGGIGKGYAVDRMAEILTRRGFDTALIMASGSSLYGIGAPPNETRGWPVQLPGVAETVFLKDLSLAASGASEKFFCAEGKRYCHILDPRTGYPAPEIRPVWVVARHAIDSEAWTKPYLLNGADWVAQHSKR